MHVCAEVFTNYLKQKNLHFSAYVDNDGDTIVDFPYQGKVCKFVFSGTSTYYMSIYLVLERAPEDKNADAIFVCNDLNCRYKWATFYVDGDRDIVVHDDAILTVESAAEEAFELLLRILKISEDAKPTIMRVIYA